MHPLLIQSHEFCYSLLLKGGGLVQRDEREQRHTLADWCPATEEVMSSGEADCLTQVTGLRGAVWSCLSYFAMCHGLKRGWLFSLIPAKASDFSCIPRPLHIYRETHSSINFFIFSPLKNKQTTNKKKVQRQRKTLAVTLLTCCFNVSFSFKQNHTN